MKRRSFLTVTATASIAGCTDSSNTESQNPNSDKSESADGSDPDNDHRKSPDAFDEYEWWNRISGYNLTVSEGMLYGTAHRDEEDDEFYGETGYGNIFSLNLQNGELRWTQRFHGSLQALVVKDAVYCEVANDAGNTWILAIEFDGTERWIGGEGHDILGGSLEHVTQNAVYVSDDRHLKAIDPIAGDLLWKFPGIGWVHFDTTAGATPKTASVYGIIDGDIAALDLDERSVQWRYEHEGDYSSFDVSDGIVYTTNNESVAAIADGQERWQTKLSSSAAAGADGQEDWQERERTSLRIYGVASDLVLVKDDSHLYAVDVTDGKKQWEQEMTRHLRSANRLYEGELRIHDNRIYSGKHGEQEISVFKLDDGTELWSTDIGGEVWSWEIVSEDPFGSGDSVFVETRRKVHRVNRDGEVTHTWNPGVVSDFVVDESMIISADSGTYALESQ